MEASKSGAGAAPIGLSALRACYSSTFACNYATYGCRSRDARPRPLYILPKNEMERSWAPWKSSKDHMPRVGEFSEPLQQVLQKKAIKTGSRASSAAPSLLSKALSLLVSETSVVRHDLLREGFSSSKSLVVRRRGGVSGAVANKPLNAVSPRRSPPNSFETRLSR